MLFVCRLQLLRGVYSLYIEIWLRFFPRDALLLIRSESLFSDSAAAVERVVQHAGLPAVSKEVAAEWISSYKIPR